MPNHEALAYENGYRDALRRAQANPTNIPVELDITNDRIRKLESGVQYLPRREP